MTMTSVLSAKRLTEQGLASVQGATFAQRRRVLTRPGLRQWRKFMRNRDGATMLETVLLLAAIAIPSYLIIQLALRALLGFYHMMTTLIELPFP